MPPPPPEIVAERRARRRRVAHALTIAAMVFCGALSLAPSHLMPRLPALWSFAGAALVSLALCGPAIGSLRTGRGPRVAFALGFVPGGALVAIGAVMLGSALSELGAALGLQALGVVGWVLALLLTSLAVGVLGFFGHTPMGAGAVLSFSLLAAGGVFFVMAEGPRAAESVTVDGAHVLVRYPSGFSGPLELASSCGAFAIEHTGLSGVARRPVLSCETGREWLDPCKAQIKDVAAGPDAFRVQLTDGSTVVISPDGGAVRCESAARTCELTCYRAGRMEPEPIDVVAPAPAP